MHDTGKQPTRSWGRTWRIDHRTMVVLLAIVLIANALVLLLATWLALQGTPGIGPLTIFVQRLFGMAFL